MLLQNHERAVIVYKGLRGYSYKQVGPGRYWLKPRERVLTQYHINPRMCNIDLEARTEEDTPVTVIGKVLYRVNPQLPARQDLHKVEAWNNGAWAEIVHWRTQAILWRLVSRYTWREIGRSQVQEAIEKQAATLLAKRLRFVGLEVIDFTLIKTKLPQSLQDSLVGCEQDILDARRRAMEYKEYTEILGKDVNDALFMKFIDESSKRENNLLGLLLMLNPGLLANNQIMQNPKPGEQIAAMFQTNGSANGKQPNKVQN